MPRIPVRLHRFRGTMVITQAFSGMWTDGRYFVQAKKELEGQDTRLMAMGEEGVPTIEEYLMDHMPEGGVLGFDGRVVNAAQGRKFETMMAEKHATLSVGDDLAGEVWEERPILPAPEVWVLDVKYAGETVAEKLARLRAAMKKEHATVHILSSLDDVAWLFNIRKNSDDGNVLAPAFTLITEDEARLFINSRKFSPELCAYFEENHVAIEKYDAIYDAVAGIRNETVLLEPGKVNFALYKKIDASNRIVEAMNPTSRMKAVKNPVEMENLRKAHLKDGVALTKFLCWMKKNAGKWNSQRQRPQSAWRITARPRKVTSDRASRRSPHSAPTRRCATTMRQRSRRVRWEQMASIW